MCAQRLRATLLALAVGCSSLPRAPVRPADDRTFAPPVAVVPPGIERDPAAPYALLPGDVLTLRTHGAEPATYEALTVDATGALHVPLAGPVAVGGLALDAAVAAVEAALRRLDRFTRASLVVTDPGGHRATVLGTVEHPGVFPVRPGLRVADLVGLAGGARRMESDGEDVDLADLAGARVVRGGTALPLSVARALEGDARHNVLVQPGDLVVVPPTRGQRVSVLGRVRTARSFPYRAGLRLTDAIAMAGGPDDDADNGDVRVVRGPLSNPRIYTASVREIVRGARPDVALAPGDVVFVTEHWWATASDVILRITPLLAAGVITYSVLR